LLKMKWNRARRLRWAGRSAAAQPDEEYLRRIKQLERALGRSTLWIETLNNVLASELRAGPFASQRTCSPRQRSRAGGRDTVHQSFQSLLPEETARQSRGPFPG
jgi:hypothetical protein